MSFHAPIPERPDTGVGNAAQQFSSRRSKDKQFVTDMGTNSTNHRPGASLAKWILAYLFAFSALVSGVLVLSGFQWAGFGLSSFVLEVLVATLAATTLGLVGALVIGAFRFRA